MWEGLQSITNYKQKSSSNSSSNVVVTPDSLNDFYSRFDRVNQSGISQSFVCDESPPVKIDTRDVQSLFRKQIPRKAPGPDGVLPSTLRYCSFVLAPIFTNIFNQSLSSQTIPICFKTSVVIPVPKKQPIKSINDYRPVALTSVIMKVFEKIVLNYLKSFISPILDPAQFAYRTNRCVEDAVALTLHNILKHLELPNSYVRVLFIDYSSAFNTIVPIKLYKKLQDMSIPISICNWLLDFLLNRPQFVKLDNVLSSTNVLNTGAPQGCVLSPLLYSLFTDDCRCNDASVKMVKFADDTTVTGLISNSDETAYQKEIHSLINWCENNNLILNPSKTKEIVLSS